MSLAAKALWILESSLGQPVTLAGVAKACGVSRFHLAHAFCRATGLSVLAYLRARRLTEAARALADGAPDILDVALGAGYGSHEAFTRAFRARFGTTPDAVRGSGRTDALDMMPPLDLTRRRPTAIDPPRFVAAGEMVVIGLFRRQRSDYTWPIAGQWQDFIPLRAGLGPQDPPPPIGIVGGLDADGGFDYGCAAEMAPTAEVPAGLRRRRLAPQLYAVFSHRGHVAAIDGSYVAIWDSWMPAAAGHAPVHAPTLERYTPQFDPQTGEGGVDLWVPITRR